MSNQKTGLRVYVAGKTHQLKEVREVQELVRRFGTITYDWTTAVEEHGADHEGDPPTQEQAQRYADSDIRGVMSADLMIALPHPRLAGTLIEFGAATASCVPTLWLGQPYQRSVFWARRNCYKLPLEWPACEQELNDVLKFITTHPGYETPCYHRDLWRLAEDQLTKADTNVHGYLVLLPVEVEGRPTVSTTKGA